MIPPRWNTPNADLVRTELMRRVEEEPSPSTTSETAEPSRVQRMRALRLAIAFAIALALIIPASVYALSAGGRPGPAGGSTTQPSTSTSLPSSKPSPSSPTATRPPASSPSTPAPTCTPAQLAVTEPSVGGPTTGDWVQLVSVRNRGAACTLPASAFSLAGRSAIAGAGSRSGGFELAAGSTTALAAITTIGCGNGSGNTSTPGPGARPIVLHLGAQALPGLTQRVPVVACANTQINR